MTFGPKVQDLVRDTRACKGVPIDGSCDGTTAVRCVSDAEGPQKVTRGGRDEAGCADPDPPANDAGAGEGGTEGGGSGSSDAGAGSAPPWWRCALRGAISASFPGALPLPGGRARLRPP